MHLTLTPQAGLPRQPEMTIHVAGDTITIDGTAHDLSAVPEGGEGWPEEETPLIGPIMRKNGVLHVSVIARLGDTAAPDQSGPWVIKDATSNVTIPASRLPVPEDAE